MDSMERGISRRQWLVRMGAAAVVPAAAGALVAQQSRAGQGTPATPEAALRELMAGNQRFAQGKVTNPNRTLARLQELGTRQAPFAAVLTCADSRLPVEILFDQGFGDIFVTRVAGNIATSEVIGSLEYATEVLGAKVVMVLGHSACGAVKATMDGQVVPGQIGSLYPYIHPAVEDARGRGLDAVVEENVRNQVDILRAASPVLVAGLRARKVEVAGGMFNFRTGLVTRVAVPARG
ncbi:MAG TPA: carbonic anhydrase [Longimicrobium sp.]|nr:carbonic anhydrase [Longimicrobium sp.]